MRNRGGSQSSRLSSLFFLVFSFVKGCAHRSFYSFHHSISSFCFLFSLFNFNFTFSFLSRAYRPLFLSTFFLCIPYLSSILFSAPHLLFAKIFNLFLAHSLALTSFPSLWAAPLFCFAKNGTSGGPQKTAKGMAGWVMKEEGPKAR